MARRSSVTNIPEEEPNSSQETEQPQLFDQTNEQYDQNNFPTSGINDELLVASLQVDVTINDKPEKDKITKQQLNDVVTDISRTYSTTLQVAFIGLCATLQAGGTNKNKRSNVKITINNISFESKKINELISRYVKNLTPRQFARCLCNDIFIIAQRYNITGNAYISLKRYYPQLLLGTNLHERYWAADFQIDNPSCPDYIRTALRQRYSDKFTSKKTNPK